MAHQRSFFDAFGDRRLALMLGFGFAAGLPNPLTSSSLTAWLSAVEVDLTTIGLFAFVRLPYNLKFLWAPLLDRYALPFLSRRRGWILLSQVLLIVTIGVMGSLDPRRAPWVLAAMAFVVTFLGASQDIATDAYRTDYLPEEQRASGTAIYVAAYRGALIVAGAGALVLSDHLSWNAIYWILAALMSLGIVTTLIAAPPSTQPTKPASFREAVVDPFKEFIGRQNAGRLLFILMLYKVGDGVASHFMIPFMEDVGFTPTEIGTIQKGLGLGATIVGALLGGGFVAKWGLRRALILFGIAQTLANLGYVSVALLPKSYVLVTSVIGVDHLMNGMGTAAFVAYLMTLCDRRFTAFQYALFSSLMTVPTRLITAGSGWLVEWVGWTGFFVGTVIISLPAMLLLLGVRIEEPRSG